MRILIVEDEYKLAKMIGEYFEKEKYIVDLALDGEDGLYKAKSEIYDVIILDVMLPKLDGFRLLKEVREGNKEIPIIMLTAKEELEDKLYGLDMGADDYLTKPFEIKELLARVRVLLRRSKSIKDLGLSYYDLTLEPGQSKLFCTTNNQGVMLGNKEYLLMEYLMLNSNRIISKEQISNKIWGYDNQVEYNNTEVYVSFLRKKLHFLNTRVKIRTVRGTGYCLEVEGLPS